MCYVVRLGSDYVCGCEGDMGSLWKDNRGVRIVDFSNLARRLSGLNLLSTFILSSDRESKIFCCHVTHHLLEKENSGK